MAKSRKVKKITVGKVIGMIYIVFNIVIMLYPLFFMFMSSFKTNSEIEVTPFAFPHGFSTFAQNVKNVWNGRIGYIRLTPFITMLGNTIFLTALSLVGLLICATLCAYALGRLRFRGKSIIMAIVLLTQAVPFFGYITPMFYAMHHVGLTDSLMGVVPVYIAVSIPSAVVLMVGFFQAFPKEVEEAALIDGCNEFTKFLFIVTPMSVGIIGSMAVINFMGFWNEFAIANLLLKTPRLNTINMGVFALKTQMGGTGKKDYIMTLLTLSALPNLVFFTILQKGIINGISLGAVKG